MPSSKPSASDGTRALKIIVISMGIALIGGTILLFALAFKKVGAEKAASAKMEKPAFAACDPQRLTLDPEETVKRTSTHNGLIWVEAQSENGATSLRLVDGCHGTVLQHLTLDKK